MLILAEDDYLYITDAPAMPAVRGTFLPQIQGMQVTMQLVVTYTRTDRDDSTPFPAQPAQVNAGTAWDVNWGNDVIGGKAVFTCNIDSRFKKQLTFHIRGTNPTENAAETYLKGGNRPWYLYAIAKQESGTQNNRTYLQFNEIGTLGPGADDYKKCPNRGADPGGTYGWGMMQLTTPKPNKVQLWHWKSNVDGALTFINNTCKPAAVAWKNRQVTQQQAEEPTKPLANKVFTWVNVNFQEETAKTAVEALTIQRYNGAAKWVWYWKNKTPTTPGSWEQRNDSYADYLKSVLGKL